MIITFKTPDVICYAVQEFVGSEDERYEFEKMLKKYIKSDELVSIEFNIGQEPKVLLQK